MSVGKDCLDLSNLDKQEIFELVALAESYEKGQKPKALKKDVKVANLFFENSTRTVTSFQMAEHNLGLSRFDLNLAASSVKKGETLSDTLKTVESIGMDIAVVRHSEDAWFNTVKQEGVKLALVNAGDGAGVHPSQTMLDLLTIKQEFGKFDGLNVLMVGDLSHSRVVNSDAHVFKKLGMGLTFAGPKEWWNEDLNNYGRYVELDEGIKDADVVMCLRVQNERLDDKEASSFSVDDYVSHYRVDEARAKLMKDSAIFMHPGPVNRGIEIESKLVDGPRSRIFKQMKNGVFARMALLTKVLQANDWMED
ncbi:aspartate carbamoyltransferase catalytic subunit [Fructobacillus sp. M2-14]|uniref:Aspartate carbamoyltransferase n=1 Tax=Fructobacillus broussonetiae TaxID=2713173 RepID=A0ABS5QYE1_9LACO|nr:aspartate carbamoyltransferase catalytic subunit [Fructobacillus broussonetiae]MBS9338126.1 aspartate carbamoyltransferase catalytic subunit [Fructobacillus broussonetiae]